MVHLVKPYLLEGPLPCRTLPDRLLAYLLVHKEREIPIYHLVIAKAGGFDQSDYPDFDLYDVKEAEGFATPLSFIPE